MKRLAWGIVALAALLLSACVTYQPQPPDGIPIGARADKEASERIAVWRASLARVERRPVHDRGATQIVCTDELAVW